MTKKKSADRQLAKLGQEYKELMADYQKVSGSVDPLHDCSANLTFIMDRNAPAAKRARTLDEIMKSGGRITRAISSEDKIQQGRFAVATLGEPGDPVGISLMYFSKEFTEIEMDLVRVRARIIALKNGVGIEEKNIPTPDIGQDKFDNRVFPISVEDRWEQVQEKAAILYRRKVIGVFAAAREEEVERGMYTAVRLSDDIVQNITKGCEVTYPHPDEIHLFIGGMAVHDASGKVINEEFFERSDMPKKQLLAIPRKRNPLEKITLQ